MVVFLSWFCWKSIVWSLHSWHIHFELQHTSEQWLEQQIIWYELWCCAAASAHNFEYAILCQNDRYTIRYFFFFARILYFLSIAHTKLINYYEHIVFYLICSNNRSIFFTLIRVLSFLFFLIQDKTIYFFIHLAHIYLLKINYFISLFR